MNTVISMPSKVIIVDPGSQEYAIKYMEDLVILKAKSPGVKPTSLLVKSIAEVNMWIIAYAATPQNLLIKYDPKAGAGAFESATVQSQGSVTLPSGRPGNLEGRRPDVTVRQITVPTELRTSVTKVLGKPRMINDVGQKTSGMFFMLGGVYLDSDYIYFQIILKNTTQIAYQLDLISFEHNYLQKTGKKSQAVQGNVYTPEFFNSVNVVLPGAEETMVFLLPIYAFKEKDTIKVKLGEHDGDRLVYFEMTGKDILSGKSI